MEKLAAELTNRLALIVINLQQNRTVGSQFFHRLTQQSADYVETIEAAI